MSSTIWIDLTDIEQWSGQHGGTQRVVYGIAEQYYQDSLQQKTDVRFFVFNELTEAFLVSEFEPIRQRVQSASVSLSNQTQKRSTQQKIKHYAVEYTPQFIRSNDKVRKALFKSAKIAYIQLKNTKKAVAKVKMKAARKSQRSSSQQQADFKKNDVLLILGKPWDFPSMTPALARVKAKKQVKLAAVTYDLIIPLHPHLHSPKLFRTYTQYMFEMIQAADLLLPISKSTDRDIKKFCKKLLLPEPRTRVIRLGDSLENVAEAKKPAMVPKSDFILCVGTIEIRKNHTLLYYMYKLAQERNIKLPKLVIVGRLGWLASDTYHLFKKDQEIAKQVTILEAVSDSELTWLYENCLFGVYPSMYEGWGLPVAEALQYGKITAASNASSIPEIAGDLLDYFLPYSVEECLATIQGYLRNDYRKKKESEAREKYRTTSWAATKEQVARGLKGIQ